MSTQSQLNGDKLVTLEEKGSPKHSRFEPSYSLYNTLRFGECSPFFFAENVPDDVQRLHNSSSLRSFSLKSPLMTSIFSKKDIFNVPMECILPFNWEKVYTNPIFGDDVASDVGCNVKSFPNKVIEFVDILKNRALEDVDVVSKLQALFRYLIGAELFYSTGSLINLSTYKMWNLCKWQKEIGSPILTFDDYFDYVIGGLSEYIYGFQISFENSEGVMSLPVYVSLGSIPENRTDMISIRYALQLMRENCNYSLSAINYKPDYDEDDFSLAIHNFADANVTYSRCDIPFNFRRPIAYQLCCAHFYSNDKLDYIYSAELFRQLVHYKLDGLGMNGWDFIYNGINTPFDFLSGRYMDAVFDKVVSDDTLQTDIKVLDYFLTLFSFNRSLKYLDYFTGARSNPLAVGSTDVPVTGANVNVVDITRKIQIQRFLNSVNRAGRSMSNYIKGIFGNDVAYDYHNPAFINSFTDVVSTSEIQNTSDSQMSEASSVTAVAHSSSSKYLFEFKADRPSVLVGIISFDLKRVYSKASDRMNFHVDRFDDFIPELQYIGDQPVYRAELDMTLGDTQNFAYQTRYQEYKLKFDVACGGFITGLPSWCFMADDPAYISNHIGPDFIRSRNDELDKYFIGPLGYSLGHYWHFIGKFDNNVSSDRPMSFNPQILG